MKPQKALHKYKADAKKTKQYLGYDYLMLPKIDGWYGYFNIGQNTAISSNAQRVIPSCFDASRELIDATKSLLHGRLIFEITVDSEPQFEIMNGILNRKAICKDVRLNVHDFITLGNNTEFTLDRHYTAERIVEAIDLDWIDLVPRLGISSVPEEWESKAVQLIDQGHEGLILKKVKAGYTPGKRNEDLMKIKEECEFDLLCVGFQKGTADSKYANTVGALVVMDKVGTKFTVSGMTDKQRNEWWMYPEKIVHKVVKVKAKNVMKDGSLREPRFNVVRFDKNKNDIDKVE